MNKKTKLALMLVGGGLLIFALIIGLIYCAIQKIDIIWWLGSKWAITLYFLAGIYALFVIVVLFTEWGKK